MQFLKTSTIVLLYDKEQQYSFYMIMVSDLSVFKVFCGIEFYDSLCQACIPKCVWPSESASPLTSVCHYC